MYNLDWLAKDDPTRILAVKWNSGATLYAARTNIEMEWAAKEALKNLDNVFNALGNVSEPVPPVELPDNIVGVLPPNAKRAYEKNWATYEHKKVWFDTCNEIKKAWQEMKNPTQLLFRVRDEGFIDFSFEVLRMP